MAEEGQPPQVSIRSGSDDLAKHGKSSVMVNIVFSGWRAH